MPVDQKIKKEAGLSNIQLESTQDILLHVAQFRKKNNSPKLVVGFAAESQSLLENARAKLATKQLDFIVANDITSPQAGFAVDTNRVTIIEAEGNIQVLPLLCKDEVAERILARVVHRLQNKIIVHLLPLGDWKSFQNLESYQPEHLRVEGFIHCSRPDQLLRVANRHFLGREDIMLMWIDASRLTAELKWEVSMGESFPHIYGVIPQHAILGVHELHPDSDGLFHDLPTQPFFSR